MDRTTFGERQAAMTATWFENVKKQHGDVEEYLQARRAAYLDRWREAARFIPTGSRVLDVGGGNLHPELLDFLKSKELDYHYLDVDPDAVEGSRALAASKGFEPARFAEGFNDQFTFPDAYFDAVFSSHCIEHSIDLPSTFRELNRIIAPEGNLTMAVPMGWERNPEHPYFFTPDQWISLVEDAGFRVRVAQLGREYPEGGVVDLFIAARRVDSAGASRLAPADFQKTNYQQIEHDDSRIEVRGTDVLRTVDMLHCRGMDWSVEVTLPLGTREALPILHRHDWSGRVRVAAGSMAPVQHDLYSWFTYIQPIHCTVDPDAPRLTIAPADKNPCSHGTEAVLYGVMYR